METGKSDINNVSNLLKALIYEFCGTALIVYSFSLSTDYSYYLPRAFAYFIGFIIAVSVSGAHFNPATSLAVYVVE